MRKPNKQRVYTMRKIELEMNRAIANGDNWRELEQHYITDEEVA